MSDELLEVMAVRSQTRVPHFISEDSKRLESEIENCGEEESVQMTAEDAVIIKFKIFAIS